MATAFQNMSTADVQSYVKQAEFLAAYNGLSSGSSQTLFPQQLNTNVRTTRVWTTIVFVSFPKAHGITSSRVSITRTTALRVL